MRSPIPYFASAATAEYRSIAGGKSLPHHLDAGPYDFKVRAYVGEARDDGKSRVLEMKARRSISRWKLGQIRTSTGREKDPLEVEVEFFGSPQLVQ